MTVKLSMGIIKSNPKLPLRANPGRGGVQPYMGYIGMCGPKGYGFAVLVINRVSILAGFGHFGHK